MHSSTTQTYDVTMKQNARGWQKCMGFGHTRTIVHANADYYQRKIKKAMFFTRMLARARWDPGPDVAPLQRVLAARRPGVAGREVARFARSNSAF